MSTPSAIITEATAVIKTTKGDITVELFPKSAPKTVANFIGLSKGTIDWTNPKTGEKVSGKSLYNGTIFHRVISDFMIQGGDPLGTGTGSPGYRFEDEFDSSLNFSQPYMLAMANSGPNTNGSQFFITVVPTTWLNNKHTIFGKVTKGEEVVDAIVNAPTSAGDKPVTDISIKAIDIVEK
ncbi:cyclophilin [Candidatus Collierbacteria bacterium RIFOXYB2_FULL_46_14]|nr:MAG: cyclophilin [Candidatus Collierbacteria bacterium RIFOXYB2_FULL_46_14]OGD76711.1 MAG: cyclophilin [Candidatus Collierbacteria bacterium RIFOXYA2_FULL_46_20]OGD78047.1 MAG: cyclophilin [Candidatus Collierbacteria bacterium RIFOXYC2_FULL_43_15]OGD81245.1 MAG: cyclophilin [Pseudomonadales bacterium GWC2_63_15]OGD82769.1 MAG: cyclophilin [Candidatus Collierbacteria bacterium RIFOXYD2_FULL_45_13]